MSSGRSLYQRRSERYAKEKKHFQRLIYKIKRPALKRGYTKNQIAAELGVSHTCIYQWWIGYSLSAKRKTIERLNCPLIEWLCPRSHCRNSSLHAGYLIKSHCLRPGQARYC